MAQAATLFVQPVGTVINANGNSGPLNASSYRELAIDINISARTGTPSIQFFVDRLDANNIAFNLWTSSVITATGQISQSIGAGLNLAQSFGANVQFRWVVSGSTSFTYSASVIGK